MEIMKAFLLPFVLAALLCVNARKPHIVLIVADDLGYADLGFMGSEIQTPVIDKLAQEGRILKNYYVQSSCSPTRSAIHTGRYPMRINMDLAMLGTTPRGVPLNETFMPQVLKHEGYHTHAVGKWHLGDHAWEFTPTFRGYDTFLGYLSGGESYFTHGDKWFIPHWLDRTPFPMINQYDFRRQTRSNCGSKCSTVELGANNHYSTHLFTAEATRIINTHNASEPLFLYLAYQAVHGPTEAVDSYVEPYLHVKDRRRQVYCGMLAALDEGVGNVTQALKTSGLWDNTLLVFTTDNGGPTDTCDPQGSSNGPLKKGKCSLHEGGVRGIAFMSGGRHVLPVDLAGKPYTNLMHAVDFLPTFASFAGNDSPHTNLAPDGVNHHKGLLSLTSPEVRQDVFLGFQDSQRKGSALRSGRWKIMRGPTELTGITALGGKIMGPIINDVKTHNYTRRLGQNYALNETLLAMLEDNYVPSANKIPELAGGRIHWPWNQDGKIRLFDIVADIREQHDVSRLLPDVVQELVPRLDAFAGQAPPAGTDPALSPQCTSQKPPKHWNTDGPGGMPALTPYCDLHKSNEVLI